MFLVDSNFCDSLVLGPAAEHTLQPWVSQRNLSRTASDSEAGKLDFSKRPKIVDYPCLI